MSHVLGSPLQAPGWGWVEVAGSIDSLSDLDTQEHLPSASGLGAKRATGARCRQGAKGVAYRASTLS